ncbi:MAG TPA: ATPase F0F1 [Gammaproteobacteria bacterium]|nr:ATPase F0F1 [Gammaproteobacteria bacterium]
MNEPMALVLTMMLPFAEGALLGVFFFTGLWWTVRKLESAKSVALLFFSSMLIRTSVVILGFYYLLGEDWQHLTAGLIGFIIARIIISRIIRITDPSNSMLQINRNES